MRVRLKHRELAQRLARRPITQNRWAQMLGISRGHLSDLVNGRHVYPAPRTRRKLLEGLGVDFEILFEVELLEERQTRPPQKAHRPARMRAAAPLLPVNPDSRTGGRKKMPALIDDLRNAIRTLSRAPAFTAVVLLTLALGVGANTAIFSVVYGVLFEAMPFPESHRLAFLPRDGDTEADVSIPDGVDIRSQASTLEEIALFMPFWAFDLVGSGQPERLSGAVVEPEFFEVLGVKPPKGRLLQAEDNSPGAPRVAVISEGLWKRRFGKAEDILGRTVRLSGEAATIVGVVSPQVDFLEIGTELWMPVAAATPWALQQRGTNNFEAIARLADGASLEQARQELGAIALAVLGVALGAAGALLLSRLLSGLLFGVSPTDPATYLLASISLLAMALLACYLPARRASGVDPVETLRWE